MKFIKATLHKDLRNVNGVDAFSQHRVYWVSLRCTTHNETTVMVFGEDENVDGFLAEYGHRSIMTLHNRDGVMSALAVAEVFKSRGVKIYPGEYWMADDGRKTFREIYNYAVRASSPRMELMGKVMDATGCTYDSVISWALGRKNPSLEHKRQIADALGMEVTDLFPE